MLILAVDTSGRHGSVAVLRDQKVLATIGGLSDQPYASRLFVDVNKVLGEAQITLERVELFAVASGPGSFTGLRVGLTAVKGWAEVFGRPIAPISVLEAVAVQAPTRGTLVAPVMDARGGQVFGGIFRWRDAADGQMELLGEEVVLAADEFVQWVARQTPQGESPLFLSPTIEAIRPALASSLLAGARIEEVSGTLAPFIGRLGYARALQGHLVDSLSLDANYVRRSDAEVNWRGP